MAGGIGALLVTIGADTSEFVSALNTADKAVGKFTTSIDRRLLDPLAKVTGAAAAAAGGLFMFAKGAADVVDEIGKLSQKVGVSVESLSALKYAAELSDVSLDQLGQGLKQLSKYMVENNVQGISTEEMLLRIADEFEAAADGAGKTAVAMRYFGKSGADLIPMLNQGRAGIEDLRKEAQRLGVVFSTEMAQKAEAFNDSMTRLKNASQGVQVELAGPFVKALGEAANGLLEAKKNGDGFVQTLGEMIRLLVSGNDLQMVTKDLADAGEQLLKAQNHLDRARRGDLPARPGKSMADDVRDAQTAVNGAEQRIKALARMREDLSKSATDGNKPGKPKPQMDTPGDPSMGAALQDGIEEQNKVLSEASQLADEQRAREREQTRKAHALDLQETEDWGSVNIDLLYEQYTKRNEILAASADAEEELAIQTGEASVAADGQAHSLKLEALRQSLLTEQELLEEQHKLKLESLSAYSDAELELLGGRQAVIEQMTEEHEARLSNIRGKHKQLDMNATKTFLGFMAGLMQTNNKKMFEIGKAAAIAETVINTYRAAMGAYAAMASIPYVGPILGAAAAAAAIATGMAQVNAIRSQSVGGGGGAVGTFAASPATGQPTGTPGGDVGGGTEKTSRNTTVHLTGQFFDRKAVRGLLEMLAEESRDGGRVVIAGAN